MAGSSSKPVPVASSSESISIPGHGDVLKFSSAALRSIMMATKASNELPNAGDDYDYYSSFEGFRTVMDIESRKLLDTLQAVMRYHGIKGNVCKNYDVSDVEERFDILVEANDQLLERVGIFLDDAAGLNKQEIPLVIASAAPKQISGSWNKKTFKKGALSNYKLLSAKNIVRPQFKFKDKVDNSSRPFIPRIKEKPNAMVPLSERLIAAQNAETTLTRVDKDNIESLMFANPYKYELSHLSHPDEIYEAVEPQKPKDISKTPLELINDAARLKPLVEALSQVKELAIDLEHHSYRSFQGITCLMQISTRTNDYIIDTIALRSELHVLNEVFTNPKILKVLHGADADIIWLQRDLGLYIVGMFDTGQAARVLSLERYSLAYLLQRYCNVIADKQFQLADWRIRPLPQELISYAREDTHYLLYIYETLKKELLDLGNAQKNLLNSVLQRSTQICAQSYMKPVFTPEKYLEFYHKQKKILNNQQLHAFKALYAWRDQMARSEDESEGYVLPNHMMSQISELLPKESQGILACCNPIPPLVRQNLPSLHALIAEAREVSLSKPVLKSPSPGKKSWKDRSKEKERMMNPLFSPHDLSHLEKRRVSGTSNDQMEVDSENGGSLKIVPVAEASKPGIGAFSWNSQVAPATDKAAQTAASIRTGLDNPFLMFLPQDLLGLKDKNPRSTNAMWKLRKHTAKPVKVIKDETPEIKKAKIFKKEEEIGLVKCTLSEIADKDEDLQTSKKERVKAMRSGPIKPVASIPCTNKAMRRRDKQTARIELPSAPVPVKPEEPSVSGEGAPTVKKRKKEKLTMESVAEQGFQGHDYSKSDFAIFSEPSAKKGKKGKKGKKEYDPDAKVLQSDFKNARKPKLNPLSGQKNVTFGKSSTSNPTSWPKR